MKYYKSELINFYLIADDFSLESLINKLNNITTIALDTEVYSLVKGYGNKASVFDPHTSRVRLIQINFKGNYKPFLIDLFKLSPQGIEKLTAYLSDPNVLKILFNTKFDLKVLRSTLGIWLPNTKCAYINMLKLALCTGYKSAILRENSYKAMCRDYLNVHLDKTEASSNWSLPELSLSQLTYAALDVGATKNSKLDSMLLAGYELIEKELLEVFHVKESLDIDQDVVPIIAKSEYTGMPVCKDLLNKFFIGANQSLEKIKLKLCKDLGFRVNKIMKPILGKPMFVIEIPEDKLKLLNSPAKLAKIVNQKLKSQGIELDNFQTKTLESTLKIIQEQNDDNADGNTDDLWAEDIKFDIELIDNLLDYKKLSKLVSTDYVNLINPVTGCLHTSFNIIGTSTGRMSSSGSKRGGFNAQQLSTKTFDIGDFPQEKFFNSQSKILF